METDSHVFMQENVEIPFRGKTGKSPEACGTALAQRYDFRRSDRIPKEQIRALRAVHDTFARSLSSSLSAYLRTYVSVSLISVEQLSFRELMASLPSPTSLSVLRMRPFDGVAVLEMSPALAFPMIELLLGGGKLRPLVVQREMTVIESQILNSILSLILQNLSLSWQSVASVEFGVESYETEPGLVHVLPPNEAVVSIATEIQLAETSGAMTIGMPSSIVKLLRQRFDQQWAAKRGEAAEEELGRLLNSVEQVAMDVEARIEGSVVRFDDLLELTEGDILQFEQKQSESVSLLINKLPKWIGHLHVRSGRKAITIRTPV